MADLSWDQWREIASREFRKNPRNYARHIEQEYGGDYENDIIFDVLHSSPGVHYARQLLPNNLAETGVGQWLQGKLPDQYSQYIDRVPLGGYSAAEKGAFSEARAGNPELRYQTLEVGKVPLGLDERPTGGDVRAASAQAAGALASDIASDGARNIWWFLNAPQAIAQIAVLSATHRAGEEHKPSNAVGPLLKNRNMRMAATLPAVIGVSLAVGNAMRQPGYKAAVPSEADPKQTADPLAELGSRYILGRSGALLPYEEFVKERPDVSRSEYESYKSYLFGNALPLKATLDGIHGPEVTFLGKSIPIATGVLPAVAAVLGARYGVRRAAANLAGREMGTNRKIGVNKLEMSANLREDAKAAKFFEDYGEEAYRNKYGDELPVDSYENIYGAYDAVQRSNEAKVLRNSLLYSGGAMTAAALAGQTLESVRRALKGNVPVEEEPVLTATPVVSRP